jgi:hypothetical protein
VEAVGRVEISDAEAQALVHSKMVHISLIALSIPCAVYTHFIDGALMVFLVAGLVETCLGMPPGSTTAATVKRVAATFGGCCGGVVGFILIMRLL